MIIWVDGTYGVGKTAVAKKIREKLGSVAELLESDYYSNETLKKIVEEAETSLKTQVNYGLLIWL